MGLLDRHILRFLMRSFRSTKARRRVHASTSEAGTSITGSYQEQDAMQCICQKTMFPIPQWKDYSNEDGPQSHELQGPKSLTSRMAECPEK